MAISEFEHTPDAQDAPLSPEVVRVVNLIKSSLDTLRSIYPAWHNAALVSDALKVRSDLVEALFCLLDK